VVLVEAGTATALGRRHQRHLRELHRRKFDRRLAQSHEVNRTTIITHLDQHGVARRRVVRKMTDVQVAEAAARYLECHSLAAGADQFNVNTRTVSREFRKAGVPIRPRRGWTY